VDFGGYSVKESLQSLQIPSLVMFSIGLQGPGLVHIVVVTAETADPNVPYEVIDTKASMRMAE